ncbi:hypothetical protein [Anaerotruncus sp. 1XD42-93]|uniref:hypothetical protein n=1 Tax=Anaerotruncus sp. 1XD42-93 TaxID=2320853 RepID=UPI000EA3C3E6|nr:hypothetical protein [Anaerotruncus sp. 1XD42-93]NBK17694.1 hypothetical protein [Anaerotruncus sp. 1XD42-93]RKJ88871.1 hypothetical protein D7Y41_17345 [Anaerotruncus sp. 1XD22-93]
MNACCRCGELSKDYFSRYRDFEPDCGEHRPPGMENPRRDRASPSHDDMQSFYEDGSARMLAFDDRYLYEIRHPERMPPRAEYDAVISKAWQNKWKLLEQTGIPESEYEDQVVHTVIRTACEQLGIYYERRKRR